MKKLLCVAVSLCIVFGIIPLADMMLKITPNVSIEDFVSQVQEINREYENQPASNRLIVKSKYDIPALDSVAIAEGYDGLHFVQFDNAQSSAKALAYYKEQKLIEYAEEDLTVTTCEATSSTYGNHLSWGSDTIGVDDYIDYLKDADNLPEIVVGIIDTGIDLDHEFLQSRIIPTGFNLSNTGNTDSENDDQGHGTHVAGIVVDNTMDNVKVRAYKCLNSEGSGSLSDIVTAIYQAVDDGVKVINMSLSGKGSDTSMTQAVQYAVKNNVTVCVAAGNSGADASKYTPASISECITVAAIDSYDKKPYWTNYGDIVDIIAPGVSINSSYNDGGYKELSGTSMACPFVAAASAWMLSNDITLTPEEICSSFEENGRKWTESTTIRLWNKRILYIGTVTDFNNERSPVPTFSIEGGRYSDSINVELFCEDENARIYYTTDGSRASEVSGTLYTEPIIIDKVTRLQAVAYSEGKLKSLQVFENYYVTSTDPDENFVIDENGLITKYTGSNNYLSIPETINGITVTGIGKEVFRFGKQIMVNLPDTLTYLGEGCFRGNKLQSIYFNNVKKIDNNAFRGDDELVDINLENVYEIGEYAFFQCDGITELVNSNLEVINKLAFGQCSELIYVDLPNVKEIKHGGFYACLSVESINIPQVEVLGATALYDLCQITELKLDNLKRMDKAPNGNGKQFSSCHRLTELSLPQYEGAIQKGCFSYCQALKSIYAPYVNTVEEEAFYWCFNLKTVFMPNLVTSNSLPECHDANIYVSDKFTSNTAKSKYNYTIIAPSGSYAEQWAEENGLIFLDSESCSFADKTDNDFVYTCATNNEVCTMPDYMLEWIWQDLQPINKSHDFITHGFLLDVVPDNYINAKDYARIRG